MLLALADLHVALGSSAVVLAFLASLGGMASAANGLARRRAAQEVATPLYAWLVLAGALVASATLVQAFLAHDFALAYVADNNSRETPLLYDVTGMWSALQGSILLWGLILAAYLAVFAHRLRSMGAGERSAWALFVAYGIAAFFFGVMVGPANPFAPVKGLVPLDGAGPNPLLQDNLLVAFHPPLMYLGLVGFSVPFAMAAAELITGRGDGRWLAEARRWALVSWAFLSAAIVLGMWWSYQVLGWAGYWAWDPVENGPFVVWLVSTAYLHSVLAQQRRGLLRMWNLSLVLAAFTAAIFTTFLTRSDVLESVHSFSQSAIGPWLLGFLALVSFFGIVLIGWRGDDLRSPSRLGSAFSREGAFLANNALFATFAAVVLIGTVFPLAVGALNGQHVSVGAPFFNTWAAPLALALVVLMGVGPLLPWRRVGRGVLWHRVRLPAWAGALTELASVAAGLRGLVPLIAFGASAFAATSALRALAIGARRLGWRGVWSREGGSMVAHLGVVAVVVAIVASSSYGHRGEVVLRPGGSTVFAGQRVTYLGVQTLRYPNRTSLVASVRLNGSQRRYHPAISNFSDDVEGVGTPAVLSSLWGNVYVTLDESPTHPVGAAVIGVIVQPLVAWLWLGGAIVVLGAFVALLAPDGSSGSSASRDKLMTQGTLARAPGEEVGASQLTLPGMVPVGQDGA
jgi:cytochrome c-type biogenesis protein CcmF